MKKPPRKPTRRPPPKAPARRATTTKAHAPPATPRRRTITPSTPTPTRPTPATPPAPTTTPPSLTPTARPTLFPPRPALRPITTTPTPATPTPAAPSIPPRPAIAPRPAPTLSPTPTRRRPGMTAAAKQAAFRARASAVTIPPVTDPARRDACRLDLARFVRTYLTGLVYLPPSTLEAEVLADFQARLLHGGRTSLAAPRGGGKTTYCLAAIIWAILYGHRRFCVYLCASTALAMPRLDMIKEQLANNDLLLADFPEICAPIRQLDGRPQRAAGQHVEGHRTRMEWGKEILRLPDVPGAAGAGALVKTKGIESGVRGILDRRGRPDAVIVDDPQDDQSAHSIAETAKRRDIIDMALSNLAGQGSVLALIMLVTIIAKGDLADEFTDRERRPAWLGRRYRALLTWPTRTDLWDRYLALRQDDQRRGDANARGAHGFYLDHRGEMDAGAAVLLPHAYAGRHVILPGQTTSANILADGSEIEASALQHCYNMIGDMGRRAFESEWQNEPAADDNSPTLNPATLAARTNGLPLGTLAPDAQYITAKIDVGGERLHVAVIAWEPTGAGVPLYVSTWPEAPSATIANTFPNDPPEGALYRALDALAGALMDRQWPRTDGAQFSIARCHVDEGWRTEIVRKWVRACRWAGRVYCEKGWSPSIGKRSITDWKKYPGEQLGDHWRINSAHGRGLRTVVYDTAFWKDWLAARLTTSPGTIGAFTLAGDDPQRWRQYTEHLASERRDSATCTDGQVIAVYKPLPGRPNHWLDCTVGAAVAASILGVSLPAAADTPAATRAKFRRAASTAGGFGAAPGFVRAGGGFAKRF